jgi:hypothetical protein
MCCVDTAGDGGPKQDGDPAKQRAQAPVGPAGPIRLLLGGLAALGDELALERVQLEAVVGAPVERGGKAGAAVELGLVAPGRVPLRRRLRDVPTKPAPFGILLDPFAEPRPLPQQRLAGDLDGAAAGSDEPAIGQPTEHGGDVLVALHVELGERSPPPHRLPMLALADQPKHDRAYEWLSCLRDAGVCAFGEPGDGAANSSGLPVGGQRERVFFAVLPELEQGGGKQRHGARLTFDVVDEGIDDPRLDL